MPRPLLGRALDATLSPHHVQVSGSLHRQVLGPHDMRRPGLELNERARAADPSGGGGSVDQDTGQGWGPCVPSRAKPSLSLSFP